MHYTSAAGPVVKATSIIDPAIYEALFPTVNFFLRV
jgi:hypothetical protein